MKRVEKYCIYEDGTIENSLTGRKLKPQVERTGYARVSLCIDGKVQRIFLHRLIAEQFIGCGKGFDVNHKDGNKLNNHKDNLEFITRKENIQHSIKNRLRKLGDQTFNATLSNQDVHLICSKLSEGLTRGEIMKQIDVSQHVFDDIRRRKTWKHISQDYVWHKRSTTIESTE